MTPLDSAPLSRASRKDPQYPTSTRYRLRLPDTALPVQVPSTLHPIYLLSSGKDLASGVPRHYLNLLRQSPKQFFSPQRSFRNNIASSHLAALQRSHFPRS